MVRPKVCDEAQERFNQCGSREEMSKVKDELVEEQKSNAAKLMEELKQD